MGLKSQEALVSEPIGRWKGAARVLNVIRILVYLVLTGDVTQADDLAPFFKALRCVETGEVAQPRDAVGDGGRSIGPYQISRAYWADSGVRGDWTRCKDRAYAEMVMLAFWKRYCPEALRRREFETLARVHNGGPGGLQKAATLPYWKKLQMQLAQEPRLISYHVQNRVLRATR